MIGQQVIMEYEHNALCDRTEEFALRIIRLYRSLPRAAEAQVIGRQVLRSGTSIAANYRAAGRARWRADFVSKMAIVVEESDETALWLRLLVRSQIIAASRLAPLMREANELLKVFSASHSTARQKKKAPTKSDHPIIGSSDHPMSKPAKTGL